MIKEKSLSTDVFHPPTTDKSARNNHYGVEDDACLVLGLFVTAISVTLTNTLWASY